MAEPKKPWTWRARIAAMPPIDWDALALLERPGRKGRRRPLSEIMAWRESWHRNRKAEQTAALDRLAASYVPHTYRHRQFNSVFTLAHRIALAMEPGRWYGQGDLWRPAGVRRSSVKAHVPKMRRLGYLERVRNPAGRPQALLPGEGVHQLPPERRNAPVWLYRLTGAGLRLRREAEFLS